MPCMNESDQQLVERARKDTLSSSPTLTINGYRRLMRQLVRIISELEEKLEQ